MGIHVTLPSQRNLTVDAIVTRIHDKHDRLTAKARNCKLQVATYTLQVTATYWPQATRYKARAGGSLLRSTTDPP